MADQEFAKDVEALISTFVNVQPCDDGRWKAELLPYAIQHADGEWGTLPPGQVIESSFSTTEYLVYSELDFIDEDHRGLAAMTPEFRKKWAARPFFLSHETAMNKILWWIRENRAEIVRWCEQEARAGAAYRKTLAIKAGL